MFDFLNGPVRDLITQVYEAVGYIGVAIWVAIESVIIPIPSELVLPFAGFLVSFPDNLEPLTGQPWNIVLVIIAGTIGSLIGALIAYAIGYFGGRPVLLRFGRYLLISPGDIDRAEAFFAKYGAPAAFFGRMIPVFRSLVSFGAGVGRMKLVPFIVFTVLGSIPFTTALVLAGVTLGSNWEAVGATLKQFEYAAIGVVLVGVLGWIYIKRRGVPFRRPTA